MFEMTSTLPNFICLSNSCGQKANYKWRSYQADSPVVDIYEVFAIMSAEVFEGNFVCR